jgi:CheY-like chemotaxis protein
VEKDDDDDVNTKARRDTTATKRRKRESGMLVLSVGQCGFDDSRIGEVVRKELGAGMDRAGSADEAKKKVGEKKYDLVLVNRVFDWGGDSGVKFIGAMKQAGDATPPPPMMLVSNYEEAQAEAVAAGAIAGFGKSALGSVEVGEMLRKAVGAGDRA